MLLGSRNLKPETGSTPWPHRLALLLCCATFPLVWIGGLVTTSDAGMAVPDWPTTYGYNPLLYPIGTWLHASWDLFIEHGHRLYAGLINVFTLALCVTLWRTRQPRWLKVMGLCALAGVLFQDFLGGMRVRFDQRTLAMIHGCVGPAFFAFTAALAVVTSRRWRDGAKSIDVGRWTMLPSLSMATVIVAYAQLLLGAQVRHFKADGTTGLFRFFVLFHITLAVGLALLIFTTTFLFWRKMPHVKLLTATATMLSILVLLQIALGAATWVLKYGWPAFLADTQQAENYVVQANSWQQMQITTAHVATGSLILAMSTILAVFSVRMIKMQTGRMPRGNGSPNTSLSGAAA